MIRESYQIHIIPRNGCESKARFCRDLIRPSVNGRDGLISTIAHRIRKVMNPDVSALEEFRDVSGRDRELRHRNTGDHEDGRRKKGVDGLIKKIRVRV